MKYLPVLLKVNRKKCVVIGSSNVGIRRARELARCGAETHLIITKKVKTKLKNNIKIHPDFSLSLLEGTHLIFIATADKRIKNSVLEWANLHGIPVNIADDPESCDFIMPSILRKGKLIIAISTSGKAPAISRAIRRYLEALFNEKFNFLIEEVGRLRKKIRKRLNKSEERIKIMKDIPFEEIVKKIAGRDIKFSKKLIKEFLKAEEKRIKK